MWHPISDFMIVEEYDDRSRISLPQSVGNESSGKTFIVKDIGPGYWENGVRIISDIKIGDRVAIVGKMLSVPYKPDNGNRTEVLIARAGDVICYEREPERVEGIRLTENSQAT